MSIISTSFELFPLLPTELRLHIVFYALSHVTLTEMIKKGLVSREFYEATKNRTLWKAYIKEEYQNDPALHTFFTTNKLEAIAVHSLPFHRLGLDYLALTKGINVFIDGDTAANTITIKVRINDSKKALLIFICSSFCTLFLEATLGLVMLFQLAKTYKEVRPYFVKNVAIKSRLLTDIKNLYYICEIGKLDKEFVCLILEDLEIMGAFLSGHAGMGHLMRLGKVHKEVLKTPQVTDAFLKNWKWIRRNDLLYLLRHSAMSPELLKIPAIKDIVEMQGATERLYQLS